MDAYLADLARGFSERGDTVQVWTYELAPGFIPPPNVTVRVVPFRTRWWSSRKIAYHTEVVRDLDPDDYDLVIGTIRTTQQHINVNGGTHLGYVRGVYKKFRHTDVLPIFFERRALRSARLVVAHSKKVAVEIERDYGIAASKIEVIYPPSDEQRYNLQIREKRPEWIRKYGIDPKRYSVLFPSTNHRIKGLSPLLEAFCRLPADEFELLIAGAPLDGALRLPPHVKYLGFVGAMEELYVASDLMVMPSHYDGFGLVVTESLACGTPVVVSKHTGASEIIGENDGLVLKDETADEIERTIREAKHRAFVPDAEFLSRQGLTVRQHTEAIVRAIVRRRRES
jgi:glycosyltransferase involved in cell wall biosynthesis